MWARGRGRDKANEEERRYRMLGRGRGWDKAGKSDEEGSTGGKEEEGGWDKAGKSDEEGSTGCKEEEGDGTRLERVRKKEVQVLRKRKGMGQGWKE
jgi:hypothetical protein